MLGLYFIFLPFLKIKITLEIPFLKIVLVDSKNAICTHFPNLSWKLLTLFT